MTCVAGSIDALSGTRTLPVVPSKLSAVPENPGIHCVAPEIVPLLPWPEESCTTVPEPSSSGQDPARPTAAPAWGAASKAIMNTSKSGAFLNRISLLSGRSARPVPPRSGLLSNYEN